MGFSKRHGRRMQQFVEAGLYLVTSERLSDGRSTREIVAAALAGGARLIQLREKELTGRALFELARHVRRMTAEADALLIINDRLDIALAVEADGVHLGQDDLPMEAARSIAPHLIIGASSHSVEEARQAEARGASYVNIGPIFPTLTKAWTAEFLGIEGLRTIAPHVTIPFTVMGGIKRDHLPELKEAGARTVALVTAVTQAPDPKQATVELLAALRG